MKRDVKYALCVLMIAAVLCSLNGCSSSNDVDQNVDMTVVQENDQSKDMVKSQENGRSEDEVKPKENEQSEDEVKPQENGQSEDEVKTQENGQNVEQGILSEAASGEDLDVVVPNAADDDWYMKGNIYTDDNGRRLEVFFSDEGVLEFAVDGLSIYFTSTKNFQMENNWRIYTCDDGTMIAYYPGDPAHLEIMDGDYEGIYEAGGDKVK